MISIFFYLLHLEKAIPDMFYFYNCQEQINDSISIISH